MRIIFQEFKMDILGTLRYRTHVISDIIVFTMLLSFFFLSQTGSSFALRYGSENAKTLLLLGYMSWALSVSCIATVSHSIRSELDRGTLYQKLSSKIPLQFLYLSKLFSGLAVQLVVTLCYVLFTMLAFGVQFYVNFTIVLAILICVIGMYGIGLVIGGLSLFYKKIGSILLLVQLSLLFITDTVPTNDSILSISRFIPLTICNEIIRSSFSGTYSNQQILGLILSSMGFLILGCVVFQMSLYFSRRKGNMLLY